jgi:outer membrane cobalamin receptor
MLRPRRPHRVDSVGCATRPRGRAPLVSRRGLTPGLAYAIGAAALFGGASQAQETVADSPESPVRATTLPVVIEAVGPATVPEDPSSFATVIEMDALRREAKPVAQIIGETVGVSVRQFGGPADPVEISIRGSSSSQVVVLLDGVRLNTAQSGGVDLSSIPAELIERIEIVRGGGSVTVGSDAVGGVVNIVTRRESADPQTTLAFSAGSFDTYVGSITQTGSLWGNELSLGYVGQGSDGDWDFEEADRSLGGIVIPGRGSFSRVNNESESHSGLLRFGRDLGEWGRIGFSDSLFFQSAGRPGPDGGSGELAGQSLSAHQRRTRNVADLMLEVAELEPIGVSGELRVFHRYDRNRFKDRTPPFGAVVDSDDRNQSVGTRLRIAQPWKLSWVDNEASIGTELRWDLLDSNRIDDLSRRTAGVFVQNESRFFEKKLVLVPAVRYDDTEGFDGEWIPRLGLIAQPLSWLKLKGNVERSYRVPTFEELFFDEGSVRGNPALEPEDAFNADVGFEASFPKWGPLSQGRLEFAVFQNEIDESIVFQQISQFVIGATNTGKARIRGLELAGALRFFDWFTFAGNWTLLDTEVRDSGRPLPGRADSEYLLRAELSPPDRLWQIVAERLATSEIPVSASGRTRVSSRAVYNLSAAIDLAPLWKRIPGKSLQLSFVANNLADVSVRDAQFFPQPGRTLTFRVEWKR